MNRIEQYFSEILGCKALIPFITAGDPSQHVTVSYLHALVAGGADILELGVPFSDPMADGPTIQQASLRALSAGMTLSGVLDIVQQFRRENTHTPVVLMGYLNPIESIGYKEFAARAAEVGVDGVLTVDCPPEEAEPLIEELARYDISPIFLIAPTTSEARIQMLARYVRGFVYYVSLKGVTGAPTLDPAEVAERLAMIRRWIDVPISVGFGIRDAESACAIGAVADAVVVGSRVVETIQQHSDDVCSALTTLMGEFKRALC